MYAISLFNIIQFDFTFTYKEDMWRSNNNNQGAPYLFAETSVLISRITNVL